MPQLSERGHSLDAKLCNLLLFFFYSESLILLLSFRFFINGLHFGTLSVSSPRSSNECISSFPCASPLFANYRQQIVNKHSHRFRKQASIGHMRTCVRKTHLANHYNSRNLVIRSSIAPPHLRAPRFCIVARSWPSSQLHRFFEGGW